jgi:hypothetical protein
VVVNASWEQRLRFDGPLSPQHRQRAVMHRYKLGLRSVPGLAPAGVPSVTFWLGPYGDIASYDDGLYLSWYPAGLLLQESRPVPSVFSPELHQGDREQLVAATLDGLASLMPWLGRVVPRDPACWQLVGGWISAWGRSGIEDPRSELHGRHDIGVHSAGTLHSIDTGKWTTAPLLAAETCRRIGDPP